MNNLFEKMKHVFIDLVFVWMYGCAIENKEYILAIETGEYFVKLLNTFYEFFHASVSKLHVQKAYMLIIWRTTYIYKRYIL